MSQIPAVSLPARPGVSVILVNWNTRALTEEAVNSLRAHEKSVPLEIIIVDNASTDGSADYLEERLDDVRVIRGTGNEGFARANNRGVEAATREFVLLLNTDTVSHEELLPACLKAIGERGTAIVACRLLNADGSLQLSAEKFPRLRDLAREAFTTTGRIGERKRAQLGQGLGVREVDWLCGAFLLTTRDVYLRLGGLSPEIFMYGEDVEFCWRAARAGIPRLYLPAVSIIHLGGGGVNHASRRGLLLSDEGRLRSFALMRGPAAGFAMRLILMARSLVRAVSWGALGLARRDAATLRKAANHASQIAVLAGRHAGNR